MACLRRPSSRLGIRRLGPAVVFGTKVVPNDILSETSHASMHEIIVAVAKTHPVFSSFATACKIVGMPRVIRLA